MKLLDWDSIYQDALAVEILRSERRRVTILAGLFAFAACAYTFFAFVPGFLAEEFRPRLQARWPWIISLHGLVIAYQMASRSRIGRQAARGHMPPGIHRYLNALLESSIPTVLMFMAVSFMGVRDALGSPAFLLYFFFILLAILQLDLRICVFTGLVAAVEHQVFATLMIGALGPGPSDEFWRSPVFHFNRSLILFVAGLVAGLLARQIRCQAVSSLRTVQERDRAVRIFGQHVSPQIAEKLLRQPVEFSGELRTVCVMFLDIRDFSRFAAAANPEAVMAYLNTLFGFMIDVVNAQRGIVNKFLGDGFMAVFGAPVDDAESCGHALNASVEILQRLDDLNAAGKIHPTRIGIGLHMGEAVTGNVGSTERKEYTIIGDVVNMAARLEQATKDYRAQLLISDAVRRALPKTLAMEDLGWVQLKGQSHPARVYKVV